MDLFEWDTNKNRTNIEKHGYSFDSIYELYKDSNLVQLISKVEKWENINIPNLKEMNVDMTRNNISPIRAKLIGNLDGRVCVAVYTFRKKHGENTKYRIISFRDADAKETSLYNEMKS